MTNALLSGAASFVIMSMAGSVLAQTTGPAPETAAKVGNKTPAAALVQEVIVTSRFRKETASKLGVSIRAFDQTQLQAQGIDSVSDLAKLTPSLALQDRGPNRNEISIRGVGRGLFQQDLSLSNANVGLYYDDVPINLPIGAQLDIPSFDLERVEVLRGPQGTLFGEGAEGGALRYISATPSLTKFSGVAEGYADFTEGGAATGGVRLAAGGPLIEDKLGLRVSVNRESLGGYISNSADGTKDTNGYQATDFRGVLLWKPNSRFTARISGEYEYAHQDALNYVSDPHTATFSAFSTKNNYVNDEHYIISGNLKYDFGPIAVESISSYFNRNRSRNILEPVFTGEFSLIGGALGVPGTRETTSIDDTQYDQVSQELRIISQLHGPFNFVAGMFYRDFDLNIQQNLISPEVQAVAPVYAALLHEAAPANPSADVSVLAQQLGLNTIFGAPPYTTTTNHGQQISGFIEGTYNVTSQLRIIAGVRRHYEKITATSNPAASYFFEGLAPPNNFRASTTAEAFLPHFAIEYRPLDNLLAYASYSEGLRNGNLNASSSVAAAAIAVPADAVKIETFGPEFVHAYEAGLKGSLFHHRATYAIAGYYNEIDSIQGFGNLPLNGAVVGITENIGNGHSAGFEAELTYAVSNHLSAFLGGNYTHATVDHLSTDPLVVASVSTTPGQDIPFIPKYTLSGGLQGDYPLGSTGWTAFGNLAYQYVDRYSTFFEFPEGSPEDPVRGGYGLVNMDFGVKRDRYSVDIRVNNLFDRRAIISESPIQAIFVESGLVLPAGASIDDIQITRPRTITLTVRAKF